jgi:hypothetical protein
MSKPVTCAIHQPNLFPRLSTLAKLYAADIWVVLDDVQLNMRDYQHRTRLLSPDGLSEQWLTLPVYKPFGRGTRVSEAMLLDKAASARRLGQLARQYYGHCRQWPILRRIIEAVATEIEISNYLVDVTELSTRLLLEHMGWRGVVVRSSAFTVRQERSARLADLVASVGACEYLCGTGGARYLVEAPFEEQGVAVRYVRLPEAQAMREHRQASGLWWLAAVNWTDLRNLFWEGVPADA